MKLSFEFNYKIGQEVYHRISGDKGIVTNIWYNASTQVTSYDVCFGHHESDQSNCKELELSENLVII